MTVEVTRSDYDSVNLNTLLPGEIAGELQAVDEGDRDYITQAQASEFNDNFDSNVFYSDKNDSVYDTYLKGREEAIKNRDAAKLKEWDNYYASYKRINNT